MAARRTNKKSADPHAGRRAELLAEAGYEPGDPIRCIHEGRTVFSVLGAGLDGSITCSAGQGIRSLESRWCFPAYRINRLKNRVDADEPVGLADAYAEYLAEWNRRKAG